MSLLSSYEGLRQEIQRLAQENEELRRLVQLIQENQELKLVLRNHGSSLGFCSSGFLAEVAASPRLPRRRTIKFKNAERASASRVPAIHLLTAASASRVPAILLPQPPVFPGLPAEELLWDPSPTTMGSPEGRFHFAIDRGGTFTDVFAQCPGGHVRVLKLLSEDPANYADAPTEGIRRILEQEAGMLLPRDQPLDSSHIASIRMGTTVATNALLERKGERVALLVTRGFRDLLHIGTQARGDLFDLAVPMPEVLYEEVLEVDERVVLHRGEAGTGTPVKGRTGDLLEVQQPVDLGALRGKLEGLLSRGIRSLAVVLMHSYAWAQHEQQVGVLARELGFTHVSLSSEAMPMVRIVPRGHTACADAYLTPAIQRYVQGFCRGFQGQLKDVQVLFMRSDGGLAPVDAFSGSRAVLSGPAGGVVGYSATTYQQEGGQPVIGFDMGGTSTDVSRYAGEFEHVFEASTAGVTLQAPQLDINTVAAGGGSRLFFRSGLFVVGPESAGAHPGPACYRKGGPVTVTDANLVLGRLLPASFPCIFGPGEDQPLSPEASRKALEAVATEVNSFLTNGPCPASPLSLEEVAMGFVRVANEAMCRPIRALTQARGHDPSAHVLACFGGAGGQHACAIARALGMDTVHIHRHSGLLSALGLALADVVHEAQAPCSLLYAPETFMQLDQRLSRLEEQCVDALQAQGFPRSQISTESFLHLRYRGTDCALMVSAHQHPATARSPRAGDFGAAFVERYMREFGFVIPERPVVVDDVRVRGTGRSGLHLEDAPKAQTGPPRVDKMTQCYFEGGYQETPVYLLAELGCGHKLHGPCLIIDSNSTILVEPGCQAEVTKTGDIRISVGAEVPGTVGPQLDPIQLSIFSHRFMSIADGPHPAAHSHLHQHQGASGLLLCPLWARWGAGVQCPPHPCAPGCHAGDGAVPDSAPGGRSPPWRCATEQPSQCRGQPPARPDCYHTGVLAGSDAACVLCGQPRAPRRHRGHHTRLHAPPLHHAATGGCRLSVLQTRPGGRLPGGGGDGGPAGTRQGPQLQRNQKPARQPVGPPCPGGSQPEGHPAGGGAHWAVRPGRGAGLHGPYSGGPGHRSVGGRAILQVTWPPLILLPARQTLSWPCGTCCVPLEPPGRPGACPWRCPRKTTWTTVPPSASVCRSA
nr:5-oxoprolinase isoform X5 [Gorilla gorilla gorilla]